MYDFNFRLTLATISSAVISDDANVSALPSSANTERIRIPYRLSAETL